MIDEENPYAPPQSTLDLGQPEMIAKPTKMQRLVRVVLFPVLFSVISTILYFMTWELIYNLMILKQNLFSVENLFLSFFVIFAFTFIQSIFFSLTMEFILLTNYYKKIYSLLFACWVILPFVIFFLITGNINQRDIVYLTHAFPVFIISSFIVCLILNRHISYYNKKNCSGSLKV